MYSLYIPYIFPIYSLYIPYIFPIYSLFNGLIEIALRSNMAVVPDTPQYYFEQLALETALDSARFAAEVTLADAIESTGTDAVECGQMVESAMFFHQLMSTWLLCGSTVLASKIVPYTHAESEEILDRVTDALPKYADNLICQVAVTLTICTSLTISYLG